MSAADALGRVMRSPSAEQLSVYGALLLAASTAAAAAYDGTMAAELLVNARGIVVRSVAARRCYRSAGFRRVATGTSGVRSRATWPLECGAGHG